MGEKTFDKTTITVISVIILFIITVIVGWNMPPISQEQLQQKSDECFVNNGLPIFYKERFGIERLNGVPLKYMGVGCIDPS